MAQAPASSACEYFIFSSPWRWFLGPAGGLRGDPARQVTDGAVGGASESGGAGGGIGARIGLGDAHAARGDAGIAGNDGRAQLQPRFARVLGREDLAEVLQLD